LPEALCNILSLDHVSEAFIENPESTERGDECSFIVDIMKSNPPCNGIHPAICNHDDTRPGTKLPTAAAPPPPSLDENRIIPANLDGKDGPLPFLCAASQEILVAPRRYHFRAASTTERDRWIRAINRAVRVHRAAAARRAAAPPPGPARRAQRAVRRLYEGRPFRVASAALIAANFCFTVSPLCAARYG
jgi:hypothetical protein